MSPTRGITLSAPQRQALVRMVDSLDDRGARLNPTLCALERRGLVSVEWANKRWCWNITNAGLAAIGRENHRATVIF